MASKAIDINGLKQFKTKQDAFNEGKFIQSADYVDEDGIIKTDKLPPNVSEIVLFHVVNTGTDEEPVIKYYADDEGVADTSKEVAGKAGTFYVDLETGSKNMYIYDVNDAQFVNFAANVASSADIDSLFED